jgi:NAD(P)-dependent dehydrogenase (short-subunit alcohol dehydrogenase family)
MPNALVSGATGGIGQAIAEELKTAGYELLLTGRDAERLESLGRRFAARTIAIDLRGSSAPKELAGFVAQPVDLVVHAAGASAGGAFGLVTEDQWDAAYELKLRGAVRLVRAARPWLTDGSVIVLIAGSAALMPSRNYVLGAMNAAVCHLTKTLAIELAPRVRVNAINPGPTLTPRLRARLETAGSANTILDHILIERFVDPREVGRAVRYLAEATAVTGELLAVDGGQGAYRL